MVKKAVSSKASAARTKAKTKAKAAQVRSRARARKVSAKPIGKLDGFIAFMRERSVVGLAIGLAIGTAASGLVTQIVNSVVVPLVGLIVGKDGLAGLNTTISVGDRSEVFEFGVLIEALIKFIAIAAVIYFVVHALRLDRFDKKKD